MPMLWSCSSTSALKEGEQLFTGLKPIEYVNYEKSSYADTTILEMENVLASAPNGALFGSSYYRMPFPVRLWVWNAFSQSDGAIAKWITKAFGSKPKLMNNVNPQLRAQVAQNQLAKFGYFNSKVSYDVITGKNPKTAKVAYQVDFGHLWTLDSIQYLGFPEAGKHLLDSTLSQAVIKKGRSFQCVQVGAGAPAHHPTFPQQWILLLQEWLCLLSGRHLERARQGASALGDGG